MKNYVICWNNYVPDIENKKCIKGLLISSIANGGFDFHLYELNEKEIFLLTLANSLQLVNEYWSILEPSALADEKYNLYVINEEDKEEDENV